VIFAMLGLIGIAGIVVMHWHVAGPVRAEVVQ
jgi:hypothetical protein